MKSPYHYCGAGCPIKDSPARKFATTQCVLPKPLGQSHRIELVYLEQSACMGKTMLCSFCFSPFSGGLVSVRLLLRRVCVAFPCTAVYFVVCCGTDCTLNPVTRKRIGFWEDILHFGEIQDESLPSISGNQST